MSKPKTEFNPESARRLKLFLREKKLTQCEFAERVGIAQNTLSRIVNGRVPLTESTATLIKAVFPEIRVEWLMGIEDEKTESEKSLSDLCELSEEWKEIFRAVSLLAHREGYNIGIELKDGQPEIEAAINAARQGYAIVKDGKVAGYIPLERFNLLCIDIQELTAQRIRSYLRETEGEHG